MSGRRKRRRSSASAKPAKRRRANVVDLRPPVIDLTSDAGSAAVILPIVLSEEEEEEAPRRRGPAASAVEAAEALVRECRRLTRKAPGVKRRGYAHAPVGASGTTLACTGLTARLRKRAMPSLPFRGPRGSRPKGRFVRGRGSGSSAALGRRIDAEVYHLVECAGRYSSADLLAGGAPPAAGRVLPSPGVLPGKTRRAPAGWECPTCALTGARYARKRPGWHPWTLAYLRDVARKGMTLVASQVPVARATNALATELDDVALDARGSLVVVERKTGYEDVVGRPSSQRKNKVTLAGASGAAIEYWNTEHTLHVLQAAVGAELLEGVARRSDVGWRAPEEAALSARSASDKWRALFAGKRGPPVPVAGACVVYVSGRSYAPTRDGDASLECVWRWAGEAGRDVARSLVASV